jgi:hypothetical protein
MRKDAHDQYLIRATEAVTCSLLDDGQWGWPVDLYNHQLMAFIWIQKAKVIWQLI